MSKKPLRQKKNSNATRKTNGIKAAKISEIFSLLTTVVAGLWQKLLHIVGYATGKTKEDVIRSSGSTYISGCASISTNDIAASYDRSSYTNIYTRPANGSVMPLNNDLWPLFTDNTGDTYSSNPLNASRLGVDGRTTRGTLDDYRVSYDSNNPDIDDE